MVFNSLVNVTECLQDKYLVIWSNLLMRNSVRMRKRQRYKPSRKYDAQYKHISQGVAEKARKEREGFEQEM